MPNVYVDISTTLEQKMQAWECHASQHCEPPHPRSTQSLKALACVGGSNVGMEVAEAFMMVRKL
ncbi:MAG: PIG-L family deacetylase, partial [Myxococcota bacterium]